MLEYRWQIALKGAWSANSVLPMSHLHHAAGLPIFANCRYACILLYVTYACSSNLELHAEPLFGSADDPPGLMHMAQTGTMLPMLSGLPLKNHASEL